MPANRIPLCCLPTPLHRLPRLSDELGVDLWIKRDDLTGFAGGGNKGRKIEFLLANALASGADTVVCQGAMQSNFVRQLGAACSQFGLECHASVMALPYYAAAGKPNHDGSVTNGNVLLDELLGIQLHQVPDGDWEELAEAADQLANDLEKRGKKVYKIAIGGSSALGAYSFVLAGHEADSQEPGFDALITSSSSGSTHAGLAYHYYCSMTKVIGISADPDPDGELAEDIVDLMAKIDQLLAAQKNVPLSAVDLRMDFCGEAYSVPSPEGMAAIQRLARTEGIFLDPVYSGKAAAGLLDLIQRGEIGGKILFWHTGGFPTLFAEG